MLNNIKNIKLEQLALLDHSGQITFHQPINPKFKNIKHQLLSDSGLRTNDDRTSIKEVPVKAVTLDQYIKENETGLVDLIKMDVETAENLVLRGSANLLSIHRPLIQSEVLPYASVLEVESLLFRNNYKIFNVAENGLKQIAHFSDNIESRDFYFVPEEKLSMIKDIMVI